MSTKQTRINRFLILVPTVTGVLYGRHSNPDSLFVTILSAILIGALIVFAEKYIQK